MANGKDWLSVKVGGKLKAEYEAVLERQATNLSAGTRRLLETFVSLPDTVQAMMFRQLSPDAVLVLAAELLKHLAKQAKEAGAKHDGR